MAISKNTPEVRAAIIESVRAGAYAKHAAGAAGIGETSFYEWVGADPAFAEAIAQARDEATNAMVRIIQGAAADDWRAASWYLERTRVADFRESKEVEHAGAIAIDSLLLGEPDEAA